MRKIKIDYSFVIPSRGRADCVSTIELIKDIGRKMYIVVDTEEEKKEYKKHNFNVTILVSNVKGIQNVRNFIFDTFQGEKIVTLCDDVQGIFELGINHKSDEKLVKLNPEQIDKMIQFGFRQCEVFKTKLWGIYPIPNNFFMSNTMGSKNFIIGTFSGIIISDIRCDKEMPLKEDYDFTIKHILRYGSALRFNQYSVKAKHYSNKGGAVDYRNDESEKKAISRLKELYPSIIKDNSKRKNEILMRFRKLK